MFEFIRTLSVGGKFEQSTREALSEADIGTHLRKSSRIKVTVYVKNGKFTIFIFFHKNKRFLEIFQFQKRNLKKE